MARSSQSKKATADRSGVWSTARQDGTPAPTESGDKELTDDGATGEGGSSRVGARPGESWKEAGEPVGLTSVDWPQWSGVSEGE